MGSTSIQEAPLGASAIDSRRALVKRVIQSAAFAKSERLSSFLSCVCDLTLNGKASEINEQKIGTMLFRRSPNYDSSIDGIVRTQASRLRQRLDLYFNGEGVNEPIRITLPRGSYVPVFESNLEQVTIVDSPSIPIVTSVVSPPSKAAATLPSILRDARLPWIFVIALLCALLVIGVRRADRTSGNASNSSLQPRLWNLLFRPNQRTIVVPSDTGLVMWQGATGQRVDLEDYLSGTYRARSTGDVPTGQVNPADLATLVDPNTGARIVTYGGFPLYRYAGDLQPGSANGQDLFLNGGPWYVLDPQARPITTPNRASS